MAIQEKQVNLSKNKICGILTFQDPIPHCPADCLAAGMAL